MANRTFLTRSVPVYLQPGRPTPLRVGRPVPNLGGVAAPPAVEASALPLWCFLFYTFNQANPNDFASITASSPMIKGYNWAQWKTVLTAMILARGGNPEAEMVEDASTVTLVGQVHLDLARTCDWAAFGHSVPMEHLLYVKANSTAPNGTRVITGLNNFESVNQGVEWNPWLENERLAMRAYASGSKAGSGCLSDGKNRYGCTCIDQFERQNSGVSSGQWPCGGTVAYPAGIVACPHTPVHGSLPPNATVNTKHTWDTDIAQDGSEMASVLIEALEARMDAHYVSGSKYVWNGAMYDNMLTYKGFEPTEGPTVIPVDAENDQVGRWNAWRNFGIAQQAFATGNPKILNPDDWFWANTSDLETVYSASHVRNRWVEFFFVKTDGSGARLWAGANGIQDALQRAKASGLRIVLGITGTFTGQNVWATTSGGPNPATTGTWANIVTEVDALDAWENVLVQCARQTSGGHIFLQAGMRQPKAA